MTGTICINGRIPTGPATAAVTLAVLTVIAAASQLTTEQAQVLNTLAVLAELAMLLIQRLPGRR